MREANVRGPDGHAVVPLRLGVEPEHDHHGVAFPGPAVGQRWTVVTCEIPGVAEPRQRLEDLVGHDLLVDLSDERRKQESRLVLDGGDQRAAYGAVVARGLAVAVTGGKSESASEYHCDASRAGR